MDGSTLIFLHFCYSPYRAFLDIAIPVSSEALSGALCHVSEFSLACHPYSVPLSSDGCVCLDC